MKKEMKLGKLQMPGKRKEAADVSELDMDLPESEEDPMADEGAVKEDMAMEGEMDLDAMDEDSPMAGLSDEDLMAEVKKRGLEKKLGGEGESDDLELDLGM